MMWILAVAFLSVLVSADPFPSVKDDGTLDDICILERSDGGVSIMSFVRKAMRSGETVDGFIAREVRENGGGLECHRHKKSLWKKNPLWPPDRKYRNKWRWNRTLKRIWIDHSVVDPHEELLNLFEVVRSTSQPQAERIKALLKIEEMKFRGQIP